ncbi:MAG TPA: sigma-70 family RNA polymerase sigma factor [Miltoncostaeaceae bacterium]|nr:sigma-70 family RNA polymerase sigma factor [Miltoncostaeaceae bacterium]
MLAAAREGDEEAFRRLVEGHRAALHTQCQRLLGSFHDAEDALQETMVRAWQALPRYEGRSTLGTWLRRIATNVCLDALGRRPRQLPALSTGSPIEPGRQRPREHLRGPVVLEPYVDDRMAVAGGWALPEDRYEEREAFQQAVVVALELLPERQRAVLLLREALGFSAKEVAAILGSTVAATNSSLQRARETLRQRRPEAPRQSTLRSLNDVRMRRAVERIVDAFEGGDVGAILRLLAA